MRCARWAFHWCAIPSTTHERFFSACGAGTAGFSVTRQLRRVTYAGLDTILPWEQTMSMTPLHGKKGQAVAFLADGGRIVSLKGKSLAWISGENVYNYTGDHLGWWVDGNLIGPDGGVMAWQTRTANLRVTLPYPVPPPNPPVASPEPARPAPRTAPSKRPDNLDWSDYTF